MGTPKKKKKNDSLDDRKTFLINNQFSRPTVAVIRAIGVFRIIRPQQDQLDSSIVFLTSFFVSYGNN
jgi:hypothetical protein